MKKQLLLIFTLLLALFLAACSNNNDEENANEANENNGTEDQGQAEEEVEITDEEIADAESAVVSINGEEILGDRYNNTYEQLKTMVHMYGQDTSDLEMLKEETIAILVEQELIRQDAEEQGIEVSEEEAQEEIDTLIEENGEEALTAILEQYDMTEEELLEQLTADLVTMRYMETALDEVEVTDEEVEEQFNLLQEQNQNEDIGELEEHAETIRQSISQQKQNEMLEARVNELREEADIETLI